MNKYIEMICKQNPTITLLCGNEKCRAKFTLKTKELCKQKTYSHVCVKCGNNTDYMTDKLFDKAIKELKSIGIK